MVSVLGAQQHLACSEIKPEVSNLLITNPTLYQLIFAAAVRANERECADELQNSFRLPKLQKFNYNNKQ